MMNTQKCVRTKIYMHSLAMCKYMYYNIMTFKCQNLTFLGLIISLSWHFGILDLISIALVCHNFRISQNFLDFFFSWKLPGKRLDFPEPYNFLQSGNTALSRWEWGIPVDQASRTTIYIESIGYWLFTLVLYCRQIYNRQLQKSIYIRILPWSLDFNNVVILAI